MKLCAPDGKYAHKGQKCIGPRVCGFQNELTESMAGKDVQKVPGALQMTDVVRIAVLTQIEEPDLKNSKTRPAKWPDWGMMTLASFRLNSCCYSHQHCCHPVQLSSVRNSRRHSIAKVNAIA